MEKRFHKRYIIAAVVLLWTMIIRFLSYIGYDLDIFEYPDFAAERVKFFFNNSWHVLLAVICLLLYCFMNHLKAGKVFFYIGVSIEMLLQAYSGFIEPFNWLSDDVDSIAYFTNSIMMGIFFMVAFILLIQNSRRPHLAKVLVGVYFWEYLFWLAVLPNGESILNLFMGKNLERIFPSMMATATTFLPFILGMVLISVFDFQTRPRPKALSPEQQLKALRERFEHGTLTEQEYAVCREEILEKY